MGLTQFAGRVLDEKYRIDKELGSGGMGAVYLATHLGTERPVAVKVIAPQFMKRDEFVERFRREARAAGRLRHPNVVDVTDFGFARVGSERVAYLVMEYLDGCTLDEVLAEEPGLPVGWVVDILEQTCSAVDEAHRQGIVHRDLKPDNIWLEPNRRGGYTVKVLDFGIARLADTTEPGQEQSTARVDLPLTSQSPSPAPSNAPRSISRPESPAHSSVHAPAPPRRTGLFSEAATQRQPAPVEREEKTPLFAGPSAEDRREPVQAEGGIQSPPVIAELSEAPTGLRPAPVAGDVAEDKTRILERRETDDSRTPPTASPVGLTRAGSILGTPLYMSPEQCRGEMADARSDIYSLGVIAYQMLSGQTPFSGNPRTVMRQHLKEPPPLIKGKRIPRKLARLVMSALAKDPDERPATAAAFSTALRAHSEGAGTLLRRALALYSEHLPTFLRLALIVYIPMIVVALLQVVNKALVLGKIMPRWLGLTMGLGLGLLLMICTLLAVSVLVGVTTRLVTQLLATPLRPIHLRPAFIALKKRLRPFMTTLLLLNVMTLVGLALGIVPGLILLINYSLVAPVLMMEDVRGRAALRRARALAKRSRKTVVMIVFIQVVVPILAAVITAFLIGSVVKSLELPGSKADIVGGIYQVISIPIQILMGSLSTIITALLYLKTRQAGGETLKEALGQFEQEEMPQRRWQLHMRERLHTTSKTSR